MRDKQSRQGIAIVEFAIIMSMILIPLVAGVWDISRFIDINQVITRAAREGVVQASRNEDPTARVQEYIQAAGLNPSKLTVSVEHGSPQPGLGTEVAVILAYDFSDNTIFPWEDFMPTGVTTAAYAKME